MSDTILEQILAVRASGRANMFDIRAVQREAHNHHYFELVIFIEEHPDEYIQLLTKGPPRT